MNLLDERDLKTLTSIVEEEIALYEQYLSFLEEEQKGLATLSPDVIGLVAAKREQICTRFNMLKNTREELISKYNPEAQLKLTDFVKKYCKQTDFKKLFPKVSKLKSLVKRVQLSNFEFSQILNFSLGIVSSTISLISSAGNGVQRAYNVQGVVKESFHPSQSRFSGVLVEA